MSCCPVSIATDLTWGPTIHARIPPIPDLWDASAPMNWEPGASMAKHSMATSKPVRHKGEVIVLDEHDLGPDLPHLPGSHRAFHWLGSNRKVVYTAGTVKMNGKATACVDVYHQMMVCGDPISLPSGFNGSNEPHTVMLGMTDLDELKGDVSWMSSVAVDAFLFVTSAKAPDSAADQLTGEGLGMLGFDKKKAAATALASLVTSVIVSEQSGWKEPIGIKTEVGNARFSAKVEAQVDPQSGDVSGKYERNVWGDKRDFGGKL